MNEVIELKKLIEIINKESKKVLVVTNKNSYLENGFDELVTGSLKVPHLRFCDFSVNPNLEEIIQSFSKIDYSEIDFIIGIGGGSAMDVAKSIFYFSQLETSTSADLISSVRVKTNSITRTKKLALIPTTSGSGSEATHFSVLYFKNIKYSLAHKDLYPNYVVLNERFTKSLPPTITAFTYIDAVVHAIESFWSNSSNMESRDYSLKALKLLVPNSKNLLNSPNQKVRKDIMLGSYYAGKAIDLTKTTAAHAFSYYLTSNHGIPHGHAVGICLVYFIIPNSIHTDLLKIYELFDVKDAKSLKLRFITILKELELYNNLQDLTVDIPLFIKAVNTERLNNNPFVFSERELLEIFQSGCETIKNEV
jgi:alcohol dehydrogenase class IV